MIGDLEFLIDRDPYRRLLDGARTFRFDFAAGCLGEKPAPLAACVPAWRPAALS